MGPFSNNSPRPPAGPSGGNKLPVPDVEGAPQQPVIGIPEPDRDGVKKWLNVTLIIVGIMTVVGIIAFGVYVYTTGTPSYMLSAAFQNFTASDGEAGTFSYQTTQGGQNYTLKGDFLGYTDPSDPHNRTLTVNAGQDASRISGTVRLFSDASYTQMAGLGNIGRLIDVLHGNSSVFTPENSVRLSSLEGQWYTVTDSDINQVDDILPQRTARSGPTSTDVETLGQLYLKHPFVTAAQQLDDEHISNTSTMHLKVSIDQPKLNEFLQAVKAAQIKSLHLTDKDVRTIEKSNLLANSTLEVWIARSDRSFAQIRLTRPADTTTVTFLSEAVATQRQSVLRPSGAEGAADTVRQLHDILSTKPPAH